MIGEGVQTELVHDDSDPVKAPRHYQGDGKITCMDAMRSMLTGYDYERGLLPSKILKFNSTVIYWIVSAFKYIWRAPGKNGKQDIEKAAQCLKYALEDMDDD